MVGMMAVLFLLLWASPVLAFQSTTGTLMGTITDRNHAVVVGATVRAVNLENNFSRLGFTSESGTYAIPNLPSGLHRFEAEAIGFKNQSRPGIPIQVDDQVRMAFTLDIGPLSESVEVTADNQFLQSDDSSVGSV